MDKSDIPTCQETEAQSQTSTDNFLNLFTGLFSFLGTKSEEEVKKSIECLEIELDPNVPDEIKKEFNVIKTETLLSNIANYQTVKFTNILVNDLKRDNLKRRDDKNKGIIIPLLLLLFSGRTLVDSATPTTIWSDEGLPVDQPEWCQYSDAEMMEEFLDLDKDNSAFCKSFRTKTFDVDFNKSQFTSYADKISDMIDAGNLATYHEFWSTNMRNCFDQDLNPDQLAVLVQERLDVYNNDMASSAAKIDDFFSHRFTSVMDYKTGDTVFDTNSETYVLENLPNDAATRAKAQEKYFDKEYANLRTDNPINSKAVATVLPPPQKIQSGQSREKTFIVFKRILHNILDFHASVTCRRSTKVEKGITCTFTITGGPINTYNTQVLINNLNAKLIHISGLKGYELGQPKQSLNSLATQVGTKFLGFPITESNYKPGFIIDVSEKLAIVKGSLGYDSFVEDIKTRGFDFLTKPEFYELYKNKTKQLNLEDLDCLHNTWLPRTVKDLKDAYELDALVNEKAFGKSFETQMTEAFGNLTDTPQAKIVIRLLNGTFMNITEGMIHTVDQGLQSYNTVVSEGSTLIKNTAINAGYFGNLGLYVVGGGGVGIVTALVILIGLTYLIPWYARVYVANSKSNTTRQGADTAQREADVIAAEKNWELEKREKALTTKKNTENSTSLQLTNTASETQQLALENTSVQSTVPLSLTAAGQLTNDEIKAILQDIPGRNKSMDFKKNPNPGRRDYVKLQLVNDEVKMMNSHPFTGSVFRGGTRKHKKRIGVASKHHKKRRRGTKKPSKRRRATRRKRR